MTNLQRGVMLVVTAAVLTVAGCGVDVDVPDRPSTPGGLASWPDTSLTKLEEALRKHDPNLPGKIRPVVQYLRVLHGNILDPDASGRFKDPDRAAEGVARAIDRLDDWYNRSRLRDRGETDRDYAELQAVIDDLRTVLAGTRTGD